MEYGLVRQNLELILKGMTLSHSRNYAGLGLGTITGRKTGPEGKPKSEPHNIEGVLTLRNGQSEIKVFLPGSGASVQWLSHMKVALLASELVPEGCHTYELLKTIPFKKLLPQNCGHEELKQLILNQAGAKEDDKLSILVWGFQILDGFIIATHLAVGNQPAVSLYQTGFFNLFSEKRRELDLVPKVYLPY